METRLRYVEDQAGRARTRGHGGLQVADVHGEQGEIEGAAAAVEGRLGADFIIPQLFVFPRVPATKSGEIRGSAQGRVERVVDAAEAEAFGNLSVQAGILGGFIAGDDPRCDAIGRDRADGRAGSGEDAVEGLNPGLVEVVPANATREVEAVVDGVGDFTEEGGLFEVVRQIREEQNVASGTEGARPWECRSEPRTH